MSFREQLQKASVRDDGVFLQPEGAFTLKITKTENKVTERKGEMFFAHFEVIESSLPAHPVGSKAQWCQKMVDQTIAGPSIRSFLLAASGLPKEKDREFDAVIGEVWDGASDARKNVLRGEIVKVQTKARTTKGGNPFTLHIWAPAK